MTVLRTFNELPERYCKYCDAFFSPSTVFCGTHGTRLEEAPRDPVGLRGGGSIEVLLDLKTMLYGRLSHARHLPLEQEFLVRTFPTFPPTEQLKDLKEGLANWARVPPHPSIQALIYASKAIVPNVFEELVWGESLEKYLSRYSVSPALVVLWGMELASALAGAHDVGIMHGMIEPQFISIVPGRRPRPMLQEFGFHRRLLSLPPSRFYPAREALDARSEQYALGAVLFETLTGKYFASVDPLPFVRQALESMPQTLANVVLRMLDPDPTKRYASLHEVVFALSETLSKEQLEEPRTPRLQHALGEPYRPGLPHLIETLAELFPATPCETCASARKKDPTMLCAECWYGTRLWSNEPSSAVWEALFTRGLVPERWFSQAHRTFSHQGISEPEEQPVTAWDAVLFASDVQGIETAEELVQDLRLRLAPWGVKPSANIHWQGCPKRLWSISDGIRLNLFPRSAGLPTDRTLEQSSALQQILQTPSGIPKHSRRLAARDAWWDQWWNQQIAENQVFREEQQPPEGLLGVSFDKVPSPFDPLVALWATGYALFTIEEEQTILYFPTIEQPPKRRT